jgi:hypothetical protein
MSILTIARDTLKDLPISDILRERLAMALDLAAQSETKHEETKSQLARTEAVLERERLDHENTKSELETLRKLHHEATFIHKATEFRKGVRTNNQWLAFCPKCHMPAVHRGGRFTFHCSDLQCRWESAIHYSEMDKALEEVAAMGQGVA